MPKEVTLCTLVRQRRNEICTYLQYTVRTTHGVDQALRTPVLDVRCRDINEKTNINLQGRHDTCI